MVVEAQTLKDTLVGRQLYLLTATYSTPIQTLHFYILI